MVKAGQSMVNTSINITDDNESEITEFFKVKLIIPRTSAAMGVKFGKQKSTTVHIKDGRYLMEMLVICTYINNLSYYT